MTPLSQTDVALARTDALSHLDASIVELVDLSLIGKQLHWSVVGPQFLQLHRYFDELADSWRAFADELAERVRAIGAWPDAQARSLVESNIPPLTRGSINSLVAACELANRVSLVTERLRSRVLEIGDRDLVSHDALVSVLGGLEQQLWILTAHVLDPHGT